MRAIFAGLMLVLPTVSLAQSGVGVISAGGGARSGAPVAGCSVINAVLRLDGSLNLDCGAGLTYASGALSVSGATGTTVAATINNGTSTGAILELQDNGSTVFRFADQATAVNQFTSFWTLNGVTGAWDGTGPLGITNSQFTSNGNGFGFQLGSGGLPGMYNTTAITPDAPSFLTGATANSWHFSEGADYNYDFQNGPCGTSACTDPALIIHSRNQSTTQYLSLQHNGANAVISSGLGPVALASGSAVASATALPLPTGNVFHVTGTTTITSITSTSLSAGMTITLIFDGVLTFTDGSNLKLAGDFVTTADDTITLVYDGTNFYEISRSIN